MEWYSLVAPAVVTFKGTRWLYRRFQALVHKFRAGLAARPTEEAPDEIKRMHDERYRKGAFTRLTGDTPAALVQMKLVRKYIADLNDYRDKSKSLRAMGIESTNNICLAPAGKALRRARDLDPSAILDVETKDYGTHHYTLDDLAGSLLFEEARALYEEAGDLTNFSTGFITQAIHDRKKAKHTKQHLEGAKTAIERARKFCPYEVVYIRLHARVLHALGERDRARVVIQEALELTPEDLETHQLKDELGL